MKHRRQSDAVHYGVTPKAYYVTTSVKSTLWLIKLKYEGLLQAFSRFV